ncbi:aminopeptidase [Minicystis rosea]|nr:aminopeptidase [Minicystis rosea]
MRRFNLPLVPARGTAVALSFGLFALAACGPEPAPVAPPAPPPLAPAAPKPLVIDDDPAAAARIAADIAYLASPELAGRGTGEPGGQAAAQFVLKRFRELGLVPAGSYDEHAPPDYLQPFQARVGAKVDPPTLELSGKSHPAAVAAEALVAADGTASGTVSGKAVFVGYGITAPAANWDDYAGADLTGKIAVILDGVPPAPKPADASAKPPPNPLHDFRSIRYKLRTAREHKAAGVVIVAAGETLPPPPEDASSMGLPGIIVRRSAAAAQLPNLRLADDRTWQPKKAVKPGAPSRDDVKLTTKIEPREVPSWNVVGLLPGRTNGTPKSSEIVIVGAHYDHLGHGNTFSRAPGVHAIHPGADDNASGTALMLEVARRFAKLPDKPDRSILFMAFGAEEVGAIGSRHWVQHPTAPLDHVVAMLNADMVGRMQNHRVVIDGVATAQGWKPLIDAAAAGLNLDIALGGEGFGASDHASFTAVRVPVTFFFTGVHPDYHMPTDTADKIDSAGEQRIATLVARLALAVSQAGERLTFVDAPADPHKGGGRGGFKVSLGTIPDYAYAGKGLKLDGVRPDAPASRAGLQRGDIIVKVGTHDVGNIHDYMFALGELTPGREVVIEVEREGKKLQLKVVPAPGK